MLLVDVPIKVTLLKGKLTGGDTVALRMWKSNARRTVDAILGKPYLD